MAATLIPYKKISLQEVSSVFGGERPPLSYDVIRNDCTEDIVDVISACWDQEPSKRYSMKLVANILKESLGDAGPFGDLPVLQPIPTTRAWPLISLACRC